MTARFSRTAQAAEDETAFLAEQAVLSVILGERSVRLTILELATRLGAPDSSEVERAVVSLVSRGLLEMSRGHVVPADEWDEPVLQP